MSARIKIIISVAVIILFIGLISLFIIIPTVKDIKKINDTIYTERVDLEKKYLKGQLLRKTVKDFEAIKPEKDKLNVIFVKEGEELKFISTLEDMASQAGVRQTIELQTKNLTSNRGIRTMPIKITAEGNFYQIFGYLTSLEKLSYYLNLSSIGLSANRDYITAVFTGEIFNQMNQ